MRKYISLLLAGAALICTSNVQAQKGPAPRIEMETVEPGSIPVPTLNSMTSGLLTLMMINSPLLAECLKTGINVTKPYQKLIGLNWTIYTLNDQILRVAQIRTDGCILGF